MTSQPKLTVTIQTAAQVLDMPVKGVRALVDTGEIPSFRIGQRIYIKTADLHAWVDSKTSIPERDRP